MKVFSKQFRALANTLAIGVLGIGFTTAASAVVANRSYVVGDIANKDIISNGDDSR